MNRITVLILAALADLSIVGVASYVAWSLTGSVVTTLLSGMCALIAIISIDMVGRMVVVHLLRSRPDGYPTLRRWMGL